MSKVRFLVVFTTLILGLQLIDFVPAQVFIGPAPGPDITFTADPTTIAKGDSSRLTWDSPTADACKEPGGWVFNDPKSGSKVVSPSSTTEYEVSCRNSSGTRTNTVTVRVERCPAGNSCHGETIDVKINGSDGPVRFNSLPVTFTGEIKLTSTDPWWALLSPDPIECVDWNSQSILYLLGFGGTTYRTEVTLSNSESNYGSHFYPVTCNFNIGGDSIRDMVEVIIERGAPSPGPGAPTVDVTANPTSITQGQSTTISWTSTNATSCTGSRGGSYPTSGSFVDTPSATRSYGMTCTGSGGSATDSVTVTVSGVVNRTPVGYHDGVENGACRTWGWAYDPDSSSSSIAVHIYRDGPAGGGGTIIGGFTTNVLRSDVNSTYGISGNHGFDINLSSYIADGRSHPLYVYGIDLGGGTNPLLTNSPRTIQCAAAVGPQPSVDIKGQ